MEAETGQPESPRAYSRITRVAYEALKHLVFVRIPDERGRWALLPQCVLQRVCPQCKAPIGVPCMGATGYWTSDVHAVRRGYHRLRGARPIKLRLDARTLALVEREAILSQLLKED